MAEDEDPVSLLERDDGSEDEDEASSVASDISESSGDPQKKTKKKKKKKKKKVAGGATQPDLQAIPAASKQENEQRFATALRNVLSNDEDFLWLRLDKCNLHESKTRKLAEALEKNDHITSLDLSGNQINNEAVRGLAAALENGAAPELISLNLRDNPIGMDGEDVLDSLQRVRKDLTVDLRTPDPEPDPGDSEILPGEDEGGQATGMGGGADWALNHDMGDVATLNISPMHNAIAPYFQACNGGAATYDDVPTDPEVIATSLWAEVEAGYHETPPNIPRMGAALHAIVHCCDDELLVYLNQSPAGGAEGEASPGADGKGFSAPQLEALRPHSKAVVSHLALCCRMLGIESPSILAPFSKAYPHPTVGTHRMAVGEVVARLLSIGDPAVDAAVADLQLVPRLVRLCLDRPQCCPLQVMCLRILRLSLDSPQHELWSPLLQPNLGLTPDADSPLSRGPSLQRHLALVGEAARGAKPGRHGCDVGFAIACADMLRTRYLHIATLQSADDTPRWRGKGEGLFHTAQSAEAESQQGPATATLPNGDWDHGAEEGAPEHLGSSAAHRPPLNTMENGVLSEASLHLAQLLEEDEAWQDFALPEGTLDDFLGSMDGDLCGPRPRRGLYGSPTMTGQVLPSTHALAEQQGEGGDSLAVSMASLGDNGGDLGGRLTNGQLHMILEGL